MKATLTGDQLARFGRSAVAMAVALSSQIQKNVMWFEIFDVELCRLARKQNWNNVAAPSKFQI